jgi:hypothetical protein
MLKYRHYHEKSVIIVLFYVNIHIISFAFPHCPNPLLLLKGELVADVAGSPRWRGGELPAGYSL